MLTHAVTYMATVPLNVCIFLITDFCFYCVRMSAHLDIEEANETSLAAVAAVTDDSCIVEYIEIVPLDRACHLLIQLKSSRKTCKI